MVGDPPGGPEVVGGPFLRSGSGRGTLPVVRKWSVDPPEVRKWSGTLPEIRKWMEDPPGGP